MLNQNENRIRELLGNDELAEQILSIIREDEQMRHAELVRRQSEGLKSARERGVRLGRPPTKKPRKFQSVYAMYQTGKLSARAASQMLHVSPGTFKRWVTEEDGPSED
jgi:DNA invertase Pin-like site-specific DNA recombinase